MNLDFRKYFFGFLIIFVGLIILIRLFYIQVIDMQYKISSDNNSRRMVTQYPARGLILDRHGNTIVDNEAAYDLMFIPRQTQAFDTIEFAQLVGLTQQEVANTFGRLRQSVGYSSFRPQTFLRQMSAETYAVLQEKIYRFPGFYVQPRTLRNYVRRIAPHVLGYVTEVDSSDIRRDRYYRSGDYIGRSGIERFYENELRGRKGVNIQLVDVHNRVVGPFLNGSLDTMSVVGSDITLTIDADLQEYAEMLMSNMRGAAVAIEPSTGEILAMVTVPSYDPALLVGRVRSENFRRLQNDPKEPLFHRAVMGRYPPGSVFKMAQGLVGLQEEVISANTRYGCGGSYHIGGSQYQRCRGHSSPVDLPLSISVSCNTYYAIVFSAILNNRIKGSVRDNYNTWRNSIISMGFGPRLGVDLPQELNGNVPSLEYYDRLYFPNRAWRSPTIISLSIGQAEMGCTVLQMANFAALVANGGYFHTPHLIKKINGRDTIPEQFAQRRYTNVDPEHFKPIIEGMYQAVNLGGTAWSAAIPGIVVCGKTGTSQNPLGADHSTFMAFAPKENPKIAIAVFIENAGFGARWALPIASLMIEKYLTGETTRPWIEESMLNFNLYDTRP